MFSWNKPKETFLDTLIRLTTTYRNGSDARITAAVDNLYTWCEKGLLNHATNNTSTTFYYNPASHLLQLSTDEIDQVLLKVRDRFNEIRDSAGVNALECHIDWMPSIGDYPTPTVVTSASRQWLKFVWHLPSTEPQVLRTVLSVGFDGAPISSTTKILTENVSERTLPVHEMTSKANESNL